MKVSLRKIGKKYSGDWIFRNLESEFVPNEIYGVVGHNGSGKSTLLQIVSGFITPNEGEVTYDDGKIDLERAYLHCSISAPYLEIPNDFTVMESISNHSKFKPFIGSIDSTTIIESIELQNHAHKHIHQLSSGMAQRLKLALAIFSDSSLLLIDEPCANLDERWSNWFNELLAKTSNKRTVIIGSNSDKREIGQCSQPLLDVTTFL